MISRDPSVANVVSETETSIAAVTTRVNNLNYGYVSQYYYSNNSGIEIGMNEPYYTSYFTPFIVHKQKTFDRIGVISAVNGPTVITTKNMRLGIFADNGSGKPSTLVLDAGTVNVNSNPGVETAYTITINKSLPAGLYWLCNNLQSTSTGNFYMYCQNSLNTAPIIFNLPRGTTSGTLSVSTATTPMTGYKSSTSISGAFGSIPASVAIPTSSLGIPAIFLRAS